MNPSSEPSVLQVFRWLAVLFGLALNTPGCARSAKQPSAGALTRRPEVVRDRASGPAQLDAQRWLQRDAALAEAEGAGPLAVLAADVSSEGDRVGAFVTLPNDACLLAYARGSEGLDDVDLSAYADDGVPLASDEAPNPRPTILLCPPQPSRAYIAARVASGRGILAVGAHVVPASAATKVGHALNARGRPGEAIGRAEAWPGLNGKVQLARHEIGGRWEETRRVAVPLAPRAPTHVSSLLEAGRCIAAFVTPNEDISQMDVLLLDGAGRVIGRAADRERDRLGVVCSSLQTTITIELRSRIGSGIAAVVIARSLEGSEADIATHINRIEAFPTRDLASARVLLAAHLKGTSYPPVAAQFTATAEVGRRVSQPIALGKGCSRMDVVLGAPTAGVLVDVWDESGQLLAHGEGGQAATLFSCGPATRARIDVEALARPGPFAIEVRPERRATGPALEQLRLAGGRLLSRFNSAGEVISADTLLEPKLFALDAITRKTFDFQIPPTQCLDVVSAVSGASGAGVDMRLVDTTTQEELALSRGSESSLVHACASSVARPVTIEVRLSAGRSEMLIAGHLSPNPALAP